MENAHLLDAVLALPPEERMKLALCALESVDDDDVSDVCVTTADWDEAWDAEIDRRLLAAEPSVLLSDVVAELRARRG